jgi:hypothetical protein
MRHALLIRTSLLTILVVMTSLIAMVGMLMLIGWLGNLIGNNQFCLLDQSIATLILSCWLIGFYDCMYLLICLLLMAMAFLPFVASFIFFLRFVKSKILITIYGSLSFIFWIPMALYGLPVIALLFAQLMSNDHNCSLSTYQSFIHFKCFSDAVLGCFCLFAFYAIISGVIGLVWLIRRKCAQS